MDFKLCGFYRELEHGIETAPSLHENISNRPQNDEEKIVHYLENGNIDAVSFGIVTDILDPTGNVIIGGLKILTDGIWAWPNDLIYYINKYHARIPNEFVEHMRANNWTVPLEAKSIVEGQE